MTGAKDTEQGSGFGARFRFLFASSTVSGLGDGIRLTALPLLVASITRNPLVIAGVAIVQNAPWLLVSLVGGAYVDRVDRMLLMKRLQTIRFGIALLLALAVLVGWIDLVVLCVSVLLLGACEVLFSSAAPAVLPRIVPRSLLPRANSRLYGGELLTTGFGGPPLGALLYSVATFLPFVADGLTFGASALLLRGVDGDFRPENTDRRSLRSDIAEGWRWVWRNPTMRTISLVVTFMNVARQASMATFVLFALKDLGLSAFGYGLLNTSVAVGAAVASVAADRIGWQRVGLVLVTAVSGVGVATLSMGLTTNPWVVGIASGGFGYAMMTWNVVSTSVRQTMVPDRLLGRVNSSIRFVSWGCMPIGSAVGGALAAALGLRAPLLLAGAVIIVAGLVSANWLIKIGAPDLRNVGNAVAG